MLRVCWHFQARSIQGRSLVCVPLENVALHFDCKLGLHGTMEASASKDNSEIIELFRGVLRRGRGGVAKSVDVSLKF